MTDTTTPTATEPHRSHRPCGYDRGGHRHHRVDPATLTGPQRLAYRTRRSFGWLASLVVRITILMLFVAGIVVSWRWILDVLG